jgi:hypothetical protein
MKRIILTCICFAVLLPIGMSSPGPALLALTTVPGLGENIFGIGCAMGWAELRALNDDPPPAIVDGFQSLREISRSVGYPPEIIDEFDSILRRFHEGATSRQMYPDIRNLRVRMQQISASLFTCGRTGDDSEPPNPPGCDQPLSCGFCLGSGIRGKWLAMGGESGILGCPVMNEADAARSPQGTTGRYAEFRGGDGGYIFWHGPGAKHYSCFAVRGCFFKLYKNEGGSYSWLGFPMGDEYNIQGGARQEFEGGYLTWDAQTSQCQSHRGGDVRTSLNGLRWQIPCGAGGGPYYCDCQDPVPVSTVLEGPTGTTYDVTLRFRGVVELKSYSGGKNDGSFWQEGGTPGSDPYNIYRLEISSPYQIYYLNRGTSGLEYTSLIDYTKTIRMAVGATVTLTAQAIDGYEIRNRDNSGNPIVVNGVPPAPGNYNGQFIQMDVVNVTIVRGV